jgi:hypothetical protein
MAQVFTFWHTPEEEIAFLHFVSKSAEILVLDSRPPPFQDNIHPQPISEYIALSDKHPVCFVRKDLLNDIDYDIAPKVKQVSSMQSPVIYYAPVGLKKGTLTPANLVAYSHKLERNDNSDTLRRKPDAFQKWSRSVFSWIRRRAKSRGSHPLPLTIGAASLAVNGVQLVTY